MSYSQKLLFCPLNKLKHATKMSHETYPHPILSYWLVNKSSYCGLSLLNQAV